VHFVGLAELFHIGLRLADRRLEHPHPIGQGDQLSRALRQLGPQRRDRLLQLRLFALQLPQALLLLLGLQLDLRQPVRERAGIFCQDRDGWQEEGQRQQDAGQATTYSDGAPGGPGSRRGFRVKLGVWTGATFAFFGFFFFFSSRPTRPPRVLAIADTSR